MTVGVGGGGMGKYFDRDSSFIIILRCPQINKLVTSWEINKHDCDVPQNQSDKSFVSPL